MRRSRFAALLSIIILVPATLFCGSKFSGRGYYLTSTLVVIEMMIPFFLMFESRRPQARELVMVAVMCALSIASRIAVPLPHFKPTIAIIMLTGLSMGSEAGFLTGAVTALASNFFYSQGPWTPWQMFAYGMAGFLFGLIFSGRIPVSKRAWISDMIYAAAGFLIMVCVTGPILDSSTLFSTASRLTVKYALTVYSLGFAANLSNGIATAATIILLRRPVLSKIYRLKEKYGMLNG